MVQEQDTRRKGLQIQAKQANRAIKPLLDLKQKQANVSEARSARRTAESTMQQGNIMVLFTLVTVIFVRSPHPGNSVHPPAADIFLHLAPLLLLVAVFGVRIVEFHDRLHLSCVLEYMFAASVAVIFPLLGLVVCTTRLAIRKVFFRQKLRMMGWKWLRGIGWQRRELHMKKKKKEKWDGDDGEGASRVTDLELEEKKLSKLRVWKTGEVVDAEKGG